MNCGVGRRNCSRSPTVANRRAIAQRSSLVHLRLTILSGPKLATDTRTNCIIFTVIWYLPTYYVSSPLPPIPDVEENHMRSSAQALAPFRQQEAGNIVSWSCDPNAERLALVNNSTRGRHVKRRSHPQECTKLKGLTFVQFARAIGKRH